MLYTGCLNDRLVGTVVDITVKAGSPFGPTWDMVMGYKRGLIAWAEYRERYYALMRTRYQANPKPFNDLLAMALAGDVTIACYCSSTTVASRKCHRFLLAEIISKIAVKRGLVLDIIEG